jgi:plastocyanin domain-containing protein
VPVRLTFRQLGRVGCGGDLQFPIGPDEYASLHLDGPADSAVLEFTPQETGRFLFHCAHLMYHGVMTVRE